MSKLLLTKMVSSPVVLEIKVLLPAPVIPITRMYTVLGSVVFDVVLGRSLASERKIDMMLGVPRVEFEAYDSVNISVLHNSGGRNG